MEHDPSAAAALTVCESLLLTLEDRGALDRREIRNLLTDAADSHRALARELRDATAREMHSKAADLVERMRDGENAMTAISGRNPARSP